MNAHHNKADEIKASIQQQLQFQAEHKAGQKLVVLSLQVQLTLQQALDYYHKEEDWKKAEFSRYEKEKNYMKHDQAEEKHKKILRVHHAAQLILQGTSKVHVHTAQKLSAEEYLQAEQEARRESREDKF